MIGQRECVVPVVFQLDHNEVNDMDSLDTMTDLQESFNCPSKVCDAAYVYVYLPLKVAASDHCRSGLRALSCFANRFTNLFHSLLQPAGADAAAVYSG